MKTFVEIETEDRRLVLLTGLASATQYRANAYLLRSFTDSLGHVVSADRIEQDLAWLREQGLVDLERPQGVTVATLTRRGIDVASGRTEVPGVKKPEPGAGA